MDNWFNELKLHWTALNLNEMNHMNPTLELTLKHVATLEKHLDMLNEQKNVTSDAIEKTLAEGDTLLDYLREIKTPSSSSSTSNSNNNNNSMTATETANGDNPSSKQQSNSYLHLDVNYKR